MNNPAARVVTDKVKAISAQFREGDVMNLGGLVKELYRQGVLTEGQLPKEIPNVMRIVNEVPANFHGDRGSEFQEGFIAGVAEARQSIAFSILLDYAIRDMQAKMAGSN